MRHHLFIWFLFSITYSWSQKDTTFSKVFQLNLEHDTVVPLDTNLNWQQNYLWRKDYDYIVYNHGNYGSFTPLTFLKTNLFSSPFVGTFQPIPLEEKVFMTQVPFTRMEGLLGSQSEEYFNFLHTQNPLPNWNFGVQYRVYKDMGTYFHSTNRSWRTRWYSYYRNKNRKYLLYVSYDGSKGELLENFGVRGLENINLLEISNLKLLNTYNSSAQHGLRYDVFKIQQEIPVFTDSLGQGLFVDQSITYENKIRSYNDASLISGDSIYPLPLIESGAIIDSIHLKRLTIPVGLLVKFKNNQLNFGYEQSHSFIRHKYTSINTKNQFIDIANLYAKTKINFKKIKLQSRIQFFIAGYKSGNLTSSSTITLPWKKWEVSGFYNYNDFQLHPMWESYRNNFTSFEVENKKTNISTLGGAISNPYLQLKGEWITYSGWYYYEDNQLNFDPNNTNGIRLDVTLKGENKRIGFIQNITYQDHQIFHFNVPNLISRSQFFIKGFLFNKKMKYHAGLDGLFYTKYYTPGYTPYFALPGPNSSNKFGDYPILDAFINLKVSHAVIYIKGMHINQGWLGENYILSDQLYMAGRTIKAGIIVDLVY